MGKNKLQKFSDMEGFPHVFQYTFSTLRQLSQPFEYKGRWNEFFGNDNPIVLELGCGRGEYTVALAKMYPEKNFIGVDIKGARMWAGAKDSFQAGMKNVAFIRTNIEIISEFFAKDEVSEIWLTFPDPQMKKVSKRLTSTRFMDLYQQFVRPGGVIHLKTDSNFMFRYTEEMVKSNNYEVLFKNDDLYHSDFSDDKILSIKTFYEQQWLERGLTIKYIKFIMNPKSAFVEPDVEIEYDSYRSYNRSKRSGKDSNKKEEVDMNDNMKNVQQLVKARLAALNWKIEPLELYDPIAYVLSLGGKRIRPVTALLACQLFSDDLEKAMNQALALEVFHNFTLLHDDIMDRADIRRGMPTVHKKWDDNAALLSGDAMLIKAYQLLAKCEAAVLKPILDVFSETSVGVCEGQQYDMEFETREIVTLPEYIEMIRLKTAVLLAGSMKIGAICGGASEKDADLLYKFGIGIGIAFQIKDDILDVYGDTAKFGKAIGGDICCNKKTYLLITALDKADADKKSELQSWLHKTQFDKAEKIAAVTEIYNTLNVREAAENAMRSYYDEAISMLRQVSVSEDKKADLYLLAENLLYRED